MWKTFHCYPQTYKQPKMFIYRYKMDLSTKSTGTTTITTKEKYSIIIKDIHQSAD